MGHWRGCDNFLLSFFPRVHPPPPLILPPSVVACERTTRHLDFMALPCGLREGQRARAKPLSRLCLLSLEARRQCRDFSPATLKPLLFYHNVVQQAPPRHHGGNFRARSATWHYRQIHTPLSQGLVYTFRRSSASQLEWEGGGLFPPRCLLLDLLNPLFLFSLSSSEIRQFSFRFRQQ